MDVIFMMLHWHKVEFSNNKNFLLGSSFYRGECSHTHKFKKTYEAYEEFKNGKFKKPKAKRVKRDFPISNNEKEIIVYLN